MRIHCTIISEFPRNPRRDKTRHPRLHRSGNFSGHRPDSGSSDIQFRGSGAGPRGPWRAQHPSQWRGRDIGAQIELIGAVSPHTTLARIGHKKIAFVTRSEDCGCLRVFRLSIWYSDRIRRLLMDG